MYGIRNKLDKLRKKRNVIGGSLEIQPREQRGKLLEDTEVVRVYVSKKEREDKLKARDLVPETVEVDGKEYEIDIYEIGELKALNEIPLEYPDPKLKYRPLLMGISTMNARSNGACSLGAFVKDYTSRKFMQLSNQHCFGMENDARPGDGAIQPSILDGGSKLQDITGEFVRGIDLKFESFECRYREFIHSKYRIFASPNINTVDVSCSSIKQGIEFRRESPNGRILTEARDPIKGAEDIWAYGRTSDYSIGTRYVDLKGYLTVGYRRGKCVFQDVVIGTQTDTFKTIPGDSGSFWAEGKAFVGLRFAGSNLTWIGCKWENISRELGVVW